MHSLLRFIDNFTMKLFVALFLGLSTCRGGQASEGRSYPVVVTDGGRDIHYFATSGWLGLREGVVVARGMPLVLTCDFRDKVRRVAGPDGVMRSEVVTNATSVNITFPSGAGQEVRQISPNVNKFKDAWQTYQPEATVYFPAVTAYTEVQCNTAYVEAGKENTSIIQISVTPVDNVPVWKRSVNLKNVSVVECKAYDLLIAKVNNYSQERFDVVSLMLIDGNVLTTVPRTAVTLPFTGNALYEPNTLNETLVRLFTDDKSENKKITCVVYHVRRPEWGTYVTETNKEKQVFPWLLGLLVFMFLAVTIVNLVLITYLYNKRKQLRSGGSSLSNLSVI